MPAEWERYCHARDLEIDQGHIEVKGIFQRQQRVTVDADGDSYQLSSLVAGQALLNSLPDLSIRTWVQNRELTLVGFRVDKQKRLVAEAWVPKAGLTAEEFQLYLRTLAAECDRFQFTLTGRDFE